MIEIKHLSKTFQMKDGAVNALKDINLTIPDGAIYGIIGMSGAGKSTLVRCINLLERPTEGSVVIDGTGYGDPVSRPAARAPPRDHHDLPAVQPADAAQLPEEHLLPHGAGRREKGGGRKARQELLEMVGLPDKANAYPAQLSGGQKQRIAIARALATNPKVLLCDEATSALDPNTTHSILTLIKDINRKLGITVVVITHQMSVVEEICDMWPFWTAVWSWKRARCRKSSQTPRRPRPSVWWPPTAAAQPATFPALRRMTMWCVSPSTVRPPQSRWWQAWPPKRAFWCRCSAPIPVI